MKNIKHYLFYILLIACCLFLIVKCNDYRNQINTKDKAEANVQAKILTEAKEDRQKG